MLIIRALWVPRTNDENPQQRLIEISEYCGQRSHTPRKGGKKRSYTKD